MTIIACCCNQGTPGKCCCEVALPSTLYLTMSVTGACGPCFNVVDRPITINPDVVDYPDYRRCNSMSTTQPGPGFAYGRYTPLPFPFPSPIPYLWGCVVSFQFGCNAAPGGIGISPFMVFDTHHTPASGSIIDGVSGFALEMDILSCSPFHAIATTIFAASPPTLTVSESSDLTQRPSVLCGVAGTSTFSVEIHE
jgi:hypothetical protein